MSATAIELPAPATLFGTNDAMAIAAEAAARAEVFKRVLEERNLIRRIGNSEHIDIAGWQFLGSMFGVFGVVCWTHALVREDGARYGWEARAEARTLAGEVVGAAEAMCSKDESRWASKDEYALRSMAQTRAVSRALRMPLAFVVVMAGFQADHDEPSPEVEGSLQAHSDDAPRNAARAGDGGEAHLSSVESLPTAVSDTPVSEGPSLEPAMIAEEHSAAPLNGDGPTNAEAGTQAAAEGRGAPLTSAAPASALADEGQWVVLLSLCDDNETQAVNRLNRANRTRFNYTTARANATREHFDRALQEG